MKTPINSTLDWIERFKTINGKYPTGEEITAQLVMQLPIERETIEKAYVAGSLDGSMSLNKRGYKDKHQYYNDNYND